MEETVWCAEWNSRFLSHLDSDAAAPPENPEATWHALRTEFADYLHDTHGSDPESRQLDYLGD